MKQLILHGLKARKIQTASIILTIVISVAVLFSTGAIFAGINSGIALNTERGGAQLLVVPKTAATEISDTALLFTGAPAAIYFPAKTADRIAALPGIERSTVQFFSQTLNESCCSTTGATRLIGADFSTDWNVAAFATKPLTGSLKSDEIIIGADVGGSIGSQIMILNKQYTVVDKLQASGSDLDNSIILAIEVARAVSQTSAGLFHLWDAYGSPDTLVSCMLIDLDGTKEATVITNQVNAMGDVTVLKRSDVVAKAQQQLESVLTVLFAVGALFLVMVIVQLFARFYSCVWDRKSELALYRAVGASKRDVRKLIIGEIAAMVGIGYVLGIVCGLIVYFALSELLQSNMAFPFVGMDALMLTVLALAVLVLFAVLALVAIVAPLRQVARLEPSLAMQQGDID